MGMQVALWIGTALVFSLAQVGMILAWVVTGSMPVHRRPEPLLQTALAAGRAGPWPLSPRLPRQM